MSTSKRKEPASPPQRSQRSKKVPPGQPRARPIRSCLTCRDRKKGCDKSQPICGSCILNPDPNKPCVYAHGKTEVLKAHKEKMQSLKEAFAISVASSTAYDSSKFEGIENPNVESLLVNESAFEEDVADDSADVDNRWRKSLIDEGMEPSARSSSNYTSMKLWEASQTSLQRNSPDGQLAGVASPYSSPGAFLENSGTDPNDVTISTNIHQQNDQFCQGQFLGLDVVSLKQHVPDIVDTNLLMSPKNRHRTSMKQQPPAYESQQSQSPMQWTATIDQGYYALPSDDSSVRQPKEYADGTAERYQHNPLSVHEWNETTFIHPTNPSTDSSAMPTNHFLPRPSMQTMMHQQQRYHPYGPSTLTDPSPGFNTHLSGRHDNWYSTNANTLSHPGGFDSEGAQESHDRQSDSVVNRMPAYDPVNGQRY